MGKRHELIPFAAGIVLAAYLALKIPQNSAIYLAPYALMLLPGIKRKSFPFAAASLFALAFLEWVLLHNYIALIVMVIAILETPLRVEKQPVKFWERLLNVLVGGTIAYVSIVSQDVSFKAVGILSALGLISSDRSISGGALVTSSAFFLGIAISGTSDMDPNISLGIGAILLLYSLNHLRKLLR